MLIGPFRPFGKFLRLFFLRLASLAITLQLPVVAAEWHGNVKLMSDYIYRGYSKSRGNPVAQGLIEYQNNSGWFGGLAASQIRFDDQINADRAEVEFKPYLGWTVPVAGDLRAELSATGYIFDNKIFNQTANYTELYASLHYQDWLSILVSFAPNAYQRQVDVANYELNFRRDLLDTVQFSTGLGYYQAGSLLGQNYFYWNAGISWFATDYLSIDLRYVDASLNAQQEEENHHDEFYPRPQDNKYLFSVTLGF